MFNSLIRRKLTKINGLEPALLKFRFLSLSCLQLRNSKYFQEQKIIIFKSFTSEPNLKNVGFIVKQM